MLFRVDQSEHPCSDAGEQDAGVAFIGFRTFGALSWFCFDALRRKLANVLRMSVRALFL